MYTTSAIQSKPVTRLSKENVLFKLPNQHLRSVSSTGALANVAQEAFLDDLDPDEQAALKELEKYREDDLAPLDGSFTSDNEEESIVELGTPVKDAYRLYLRKRSQGSSDEDESGDAKLKEDGHEETDTMVALFATVSSLQDMTRDPFNKMTACDVIRDSDDDCQLEGAKNHLDIAQQSPQRDHSGFMFFLGLGLVITVCAQFVWSLISQAYDEGAAQKS
ncbi:hypothetical protein J1614_002290 [Plenodomus biglobosus]|nr:hypothetical protein J1614_002290 [Plenodomus biglobosus]